MFQLSEQLQDLLPGQVEANLDVSGLVTITVIVDDRNIEILSSNSTVDSNWV